MPVSFATLQLAKEYVNNEYPHLKIFEQMAVIKNEYCMASRFALRTYQTVKEIQNELLNQHNSPSIHKNS